MTHRNDNRQPAPLAAAETLDALFAQRVARSPERPAYLWCDRAGDWHTLTWFDMGAALARWRAALEAEGLAAGDRVAMLLRNGPEWVLFDQAALALGLVSVPLYTDDRADNAAWILRDSGARLLLIQDAGRWKRLAEALDRTPCPDLRRILILDPSPGASVLARDGGGRIQVLEDWLDQGAASVAGTSSTAEAASAAGTASTASVSEPRNGDPDALATIVYTSGTTGRPKGVMLTHRNLLANVRGVLDLVACRPEDVFLSFLPLSHTLERTGGYYLPLMAGASVAFARSVNQLAEDLRAVRPTVIIAVPRVFERVWRRLQERLRARPAPVRWLFALTVAAGWRAFQYAQGQAGWHPLLPLWPLLRRRIAAPVLESLGGRLRIAVSGGAPLPTAVAHTFIGLGLPLLQGYGLTETSPVISVNRLEDNRPESVGVPLKDLELRLDDQAGLLVRGPTVMAGYWRNPEATARILDADGWLHTGDQVRIAADGHLHITGRIKDILALSNGEKVAPSDLEMAIALDPLFDQVLAIGEGQAYLTALVVLNPEHWERFARDQGCDPAAPGSLTDPRVERAALARIRAALHDFPGYAKVRRATLSLEPWAIDNGLLTPTLKVKRAEVRRRHQEAIDRMYDLDT